MAEIRVERKRGTSVWLWVLLVLVVLAAVGFYLWQNGTINLSAAGAALDPVAGAWKGAIYGQG